MSRIWSTGEDEYIQNNYKKLSSREIGIFLNRRADCVRKRAKKLNLSAQPPLDNELKLPLNEEQRSLIFGSMMGDACLHISAKNINNGNAIAMFGHSIKQSEWLKYKFNIMKNLCGSGINDKKNSLAFSTLTHPELTEIYHMFYSNDLKKVVTKEILYRLGPKEIAYWYMDDGSIEYGSKCKTIPYRSAHLIKLFTCNFTYNEHILMQNWFMQKFNIKVSIYKHKSKYYTLTMTGDNMRKFKAWIKIDKRSINTPLRFINQFLPDYQGGDAHE